MREACLSHLPNIQNRFSAQEEMLPGIASPACYGRIGGVRMCLYGGIAQLVERRLCKPNVAGSSPTASTKFGEDKTELGV